MLIDHLQVNPERMRERQQVRFPSPQMKDILEIRTGRETHETSCSHPQFAGNRTQAGSASVWSVELAKATDPDTPVGASQADAPAFAQHLLRHTRAGLAPEAHRVA